MKQIVLDKTVELGIRQHAEEIFPFECCGFLYGNDHNGRLITLARQVQNFKDGDQRRRFEISPLDYIKAEKYAINHNVKLLGIYHSHPNHPAIASKHDLEKALPYFSYLIVSVMEGKADKIQSWRLQEDINKFEEEQVILQTPEQKTC